MKKFFLLIITCLLLNNIAFAKESNGLEKFESLIEYAASPEDKILMTSFVDSIKEKYQETKTYPKIVGNGIPVSFILFEDGEITLVLDMSKVQMSEDSNNDIANFFKVLTKKIGKKNIHAYYLNNEDDPKSNNIFVRIRLK